MSKVYTFIEAIVARRTNFALQKDGSISNNRIKELIGITLQTLPSPFNTQTSRIVLLVAADHERLWDITKEVLLPQLQGSQAGATKRKLENFRNSHGTILFFEDKRALDSLRDDANYAAYHQHFDSWSLQTNGMYQFTLWTALVAEGLGANLQHYNPLIDDRVREQWSIDPYWNLLAQMPFGKPTECPKTRKPGLPVEDRFMCFETDRY